MEGVRVVVFNATFNNISVVIVAVSFIVGGNRSIRNGVVYSHVNSTICQQRNIKLYSVNG
jgi:hypothetical protein